MEKEFKLCGLDTRNNEENIKTLVDTIIPFIQDFYDKAGVEVKKNHI